MQEYWENPETISIIDKNLHRIEIETALRHLSPKDHLADIGCGNGSATVEYAAYVQKVHAIERSDCLREKALENVFKASLKNVTIESGDVLKLDAIETGTFDSVVTQRMLINLTSWEDQQQALRNIHRILKPGGRYVMIENTNESFARLNDIRHHVKLGPIPQHWHNRFFNHDLLIDFFNGKFQVLRHENFNMYYFLTRVFVPMFASFTGYGKNAVKDPIFDKADAAARELHEKFSSFLNLPNSEALGPIQVFVLRKESK